MSIRTQRKSGRHWQPLAISMLMTRGSAWGWRCIPGISPPGWISGVNGQVKVPSTITVSVTRNGPALVPTVESRSRSLFKKAMDAGWKPAGSNCNGKPRKEKVAEKKSDGLSQSEDKGEDRPDIEVNTERHIVRDQVIEVLASDGRIYLRGDSLATVWRSPEVTQKLFGGHILRNANGAPCVSLIDSSHGLFDH